MKFNCGLTWYEKIRLEYEWHDFFPLIPRRITGSHDCYWLETIQRKRISTRGGWYWEYRVKDHNNEASSTCQDIGA